MTCRMAVLSLSHWVTAATSRSRTLESRSRTRNSSTLASAIGRNRHILGHNSLPYDCGVPGADGGCINDLRKLRASEGELRSSKSEVESWIMVFMRLLVFVNDTDTSATIAGASALMVSLTGSSLSVVLSEAPIKFCSSLAVWCWTPSLMLVVLYSVGKMSST